MVVVESRHRRVGTIYRPMIVREKKASQTIQARKGLYDNMRV